MLMRPLARRPVGRGGLLGTAARTAVVAGTATAVAGGVATRQQAKAQQAAEAAAYEREQQAPPPPPPPPPSQPSGPPPDPTYAEIERLASLRESGVLTEHEFTAAKAKLLGLD